MFIIAVPQKDKKKGWPMWGKVLHKGQNTAQLYEADGIRFYTITISSKKGVQDYSEVRALYPKFAGRLILAEGLTLPEELAQMLFVPRRLTEQIMLKLAVKICEMSPLPLVKRNIGLIDENGIYGDFAEKLIKYSPTVKVFTGDYERYRQTQEQLLELYGAPLIVTQQLSTLDDCSLIYSPNSLAFCGIPGLRCPVVYGGIHEHFLMKNILSLGSLCIPEGAAQLIPQGIDPVYFFSAAYELCGKNKLSALHAQTLWAGEQKIKLSELSGYIVKLYKMSADPMN